MTINMSLSIETITSETPTLPDAKCGDFSPTLVTETIEQLHDELIWDKCNFCGGYVLVQAVHYKGDHKREKCKCGAKRIFRWGRNHDPYTPEGFSDHDPDDGWKKDGVEWVMC